MSIFHSTSNLHQRAQVRIQVQYFEEHGVDGRMEMPGLKTPTPDARCFDTYQYQEVRSHISQVLNFIYKLRLQPRLPSAAATATA